MSRLPATGKTKIYCELALLLLALEPEAPAPDVLEEVADAEAVWLPFLESGLPPSLEPWAEVPFFFPL